MKTHDITIGFVGSGGDGVVAAGDILANSAAAEGLHSMVVKSFGPQIRGGESSCRVRISNDVVLSQGDLLDILVCFSWGDYIKFEGELDVKSGAIILMDEEEKIEDLRLPFRKVKEYKVMRVPFNRLTKESGNSRAKNMIMLGVLAEMFGLPRDGIKGSIERKFKKKPEVIASNISALELGVGWVKENKKVSDHQFKYQKCRPKVILTGNDAVALGAVAAGCRFFASYPITPASEIMEVMARVLPKFNGTMIQAEDEISAACMVTGASFGGVRAMTATSGPGFSLKIETIGLGAMAELPYVVVNVQRGGPATGMPTKTEQADLMQAIYGMHGDAPHAVIAPVDVLDCFEATMKAFGIAEEYQMPVVILSDQFIGHRKDTIEGIDPKKIEVVSRKTPKDPKRGEYRRFEITDDGVSPMTYPGIKGGEYTCAGIEHDEDGHPASSHVAHERMCVKRARKLEKLKKEFNFIRRYGPSRPDIGIITWGSSKGVVEEAVRIATAKGLKVGALVPQLIYPLQTELIDDFIASCKKIMVVEMNYSGQFRRYLAGHCRLPDDVLELKASGAKLFTTEEILEVMKNYE